VSFLLSVVMLSIVLMSVIMLSLIMLISEAVVLHSLDTLSDIKTKRFRFSFN
jgi:hypothetical protein